MLTTVPLAAAPAATHPVNSFLSQKLRFWSLMAMVLLIYVHDYNLHPRYLEPWTSVQEPLTGGTWLQYFLANGVLRFRIPILFAISGYFFARRDGQQPHGQRVWRRLRTIGLPYLLWSLIWLIVVWALEQFSITHQAITEAKISPFWPHKEFSQLTHLELLVHWLLVPVPFQLWFLRSLLVYNITYPWLKKIILARPVLYFSIAGLLWFFRVPLPVVAGEGLLFFGLGVWLALRDKDLLIPPSWFRLWPFAALWLGACVLHTWLAFYTNPQFQKPTMLVMLGLHRLSEVSGMLTAWFGLDGLVRAAMARKWFRWLTGFSFMIYVLHAPFVNYTTELALHYGRDVQHIQLLTYLLLPLPIIAFAVSVGALLRWAVPGAYALLTGGRGLATS